MNTPASGPAMSAVTGKVLSARTLAGYAADWALFTDWCTATGRQALPADWATVAAFNAGCPGATATVRRRLAAITHHHRAAGQLPPADPARVDQPATPTRGVLDPGQVQMLLRLLPSHGWTAGVFGRRDRALLTLAAATPIPYRQLARLTVGHLRITGGAATVTDHHGQVHILQAATDPVLCGPCALVRWRRVLNTAVTRHATRALADLLDAAQEVTAASHHSCRNLKPIDDRVLPMSLFPAITRWGHLPDPITPLSPHSTSHLARQADTGIAHHQTLTVDHLVTVLASPAAEPPLAATPARPVWDWAAANQRKKDAIQQLAPLADAMDDIETRIEALLARTKALELG